MKPSLLMNESNGTGGHIEAMLDYVLSWTLRRAAAEYATEKAILYGYCRAILFKLLEIEKYAQITVKSVEAWKQWNRIDLHANIELEYDGGRTEHHAILIENKAYTSVHDNQLARYRQIFEETYDKAKFKLHYVLLTCFDNIPDRLQQECKKADFRCLPLGDLCPPEQEDSESDLFNEFWLREWG